MDVHPQPDLTPVSVADYERAAAQRSGERAHAYVWGGAADELSLSLNERSWRRLMLEPRILTGAAEPDLGVELLGVRRPHPLLIAPTAFAQLTHPDGEVALARAAAQTGTTLCLSTLASTSAAALARAVPAAPRWFQLYVLSDRGVTRELITRAAAHGYEALVITADRPVIGTRDRELRFDVRHGRGELPGADELIAAAIGGGAPADFSAVIDPTLSWADIDEFAAESPLPILIKGVLTAADARAAADHGAVGVIVSNHGGRQLDTVVAPADVLSRIADAVGDELDVLVDGGIRRGTDIVKALALGARAVLIGRPALWGLAVDGAAGASRVIELLLAELRTALTLIGAGAASAVDRDVVSAGPRAPR